MTTMITAAVNNKFVFNTKTVMTFIIAVCMVMATLFSWYRMFDSIDPLVSFLWLIPSIILAVTTFLFVRRFFG